ncbi:MFS transporter [Dellaglioa sp. P0083]|uniref:MFS transporter n=1 Tax=Dellaglioa kimchii TaxID=3344667 RepID=UPI0038D3C15F
MIATFFYQFSIQSVNPLISGYVTHLGITSTLAGLIVGIMSITSLFLRPIAGNLTDKISKYGLTFIGGILCAISDFGYMFSFNTAWLFFFRVINGVGFVLCTVCLATWLAFLVPRQRVGAAMGYYGLVNALSMAVAPVLSLEIYQKVGYKMIFLLAAVSAVAVVISIQFIDNRAMPSFVRKETTHFKLIQRSALPVASIFALISIPYFAVQADIVMYVRASNLNITVSLFFVIYSIVLIFSRILLKNYFDSIPFGVWFYICMIVTVGYLFFLTIMHNNLEMALAAALMAIGFGTMVSVCQSTALLLAPLREQGLATATYYLGSDIGMSLGPILGGIITTILPIKLLFPVMILIVPVAFSIYFFNHNALNSAIRHD